MLHFSPHENKSLPVAFFYLCVSVQFCPHVVFPSVVCPRLHWLPSSWWICWGCSNSSGTFLLCGGPARLNWSVCQILSGYCSALFFCCTAVFGDLILNWWWRIVFQEKLNVSVEWTEVLNVKMKSQLVFIQESSCELGLDDMALE